jgi:hypothetical protein
VNNDEGILNFRGESELFASRLAQLIFAKPGVRQQARSSVGAGLPAMAAGLAKNPPT